MFSVGIVFGGRYFSGNTASFFPMLTCLFFHALFLDSSGPPKNSVVFLGGIFGAFLLCFPVSGERRAFSLGFFPSKWCSFVLGPLWSYYTSSRALFCFRLGGRLCVGLGLLLGRPGLDGPSWARSFFFRFFWAALFAPKVAAWILPKQTKTNGFRAIYAQRAVP